MKTPTVVRWGVVVSSAFLAFTWAQTPAIPLPETKPILVEPISVGSLERQLPVGHLGVPLGKVVRVTGEAFDGSTTRLRADLGKTLLQIVTVNGTKLAEPVVFEFLRAPDSVKKPAAGERFDYYVHEYGHFDGVVTPPEELGIKGSGPMANDGFYYRRYITVHSSNPVRK